LFFKYWQRLNNKADLHQIRGATFVNLLQQVANPVARAFLLRMVQFVKARMVLTNFYLRNHCIARGISEVINKN